MAKNANANKVIIPLKEIKTIYVLNSAAGGQLHNNNSLSLAQCLIVKNDEKITSVRLSNKILAVARPLETK
jgi:hypothetical protein